MKRVLARREFLQQSALLGLTVAVPWAGRLRAWSPAEVSEFRPNAYLQIAPDDTVTLWVTRCEMGQGVRTTLPMVLADELEVEWTKIKLAQASPGGRFSKIRLRTSGSGSATGTWMALRGAAAAAREMLVAAAAVRWQAPLSECRAQSGSVLHVPTGRKLSYGALAEAAAALPVPAEPRLKDVTEFRLIGKPRKRSDGPDIVRGRAQYGMDVRLPDMRYAVMARCPVLGGKLRSFDARRAKAVPGVEDVIAVNAGIATGVAVVARSTWAALQGREVLDVEWEPGMHREFNSSDWNQKLEQSLAEEGWYSRHEGDAPAALKNAARRLDATYFYPHLAHAPLEPMNCTAHVRSGSCEIWVPTQTPETAQRDSARRLGLDPEAVTVHVTLMGGGFGRRLFSDYVDECVELASKVRYPVQLMWTRDDDMRYGFFHPAAVQRIEAGLDAGGKLVAWVHKCVSSDLSMFGRNTDTDPKRYANDGNPWGAYDNPYNTGTMKVDYVPVESPVPSGPWRAVFYPESVFARESFVDELAHALGEDPIAYRLRLLEPVQTVSLAAGQIERARLVQVLKLAAEKSAWNSTLPKAAGRRFGRGVACNVYHSQTHIAQVAEVSVGAAGDVRVHRVVCALDCGLVVNPLGVEGQVESAVNWGLSAALYGEITFQDGRAQQSTFADFPVVRFDQAPQLETWTTGSTARPYGLGEQPVPPVAPAIANAIFAATGKRVRRLPIRPQDLLS